MDALGAAPSLRWHKVHARKETLFINLLLCNKNISHMPVSRLGTPRIVDSLGLGMFSFFICIFFKMCATKDGVTSVSRYVRK
jgi:hypothetical protein